MMRVSNQYYSLLLAGLLSLLISCEKKIEPDPDNGNVPDISDQTKNINNWIFDVMHEVYLWEEHIPAGLDPESAPNSKKFFDRFLYDIDRFSWIHENLSISYKKLSKNFFGSGAVSGSSPAGIYSSHK